MNNPFKFVFVLCMLACAPASLSAGDIGSLWGWNVSVGGNVGFGLKTDVRTLPGNAIRNMPALHPAVGPTRDEAKNAAKEALLSGGRIAFSGDGSAFIDAESSWGETHPDETQNWRLPDSAANYADETFAFSDLYVEQPDGSWAPAGRWSEIRGGADSMSSSPVCDSDEETTWGASVDLSHMLYISEDGCWGVDISIGLTWMMARNCHRSGGVAARRTAVVEDGTTDYTVNGADFLNWWIPEDNGWGAGTYDGSGGYMQLPLRKDSVTGETNPAINSTPYSDELYVSSQGDYEEWEISVLLKPWYEVNDWLCLHGALGVGVTRSSFDYSMEAYCRGSRVYASSQEFAEWRCYGIAGAGLLLRAWDFDLSCDGLFRWCQEDMDINGRDVQGTLEKPWAILRLGLSYAF